MHVFHCFIVVAYWLNCQQLANEILTITKSRWSTDTIQPISNNNEAMKKCIVSYTHSRLYCMQMQSKMFLKCMATLHECAHMFIHSHTYKHISRHRYKAWGTCTSLRFMQIATQSCIYYI